MNIDNELDLSDNDKVFMDKLNKVIELLNKLTETK
jgi:hypothetical protein